MLLKTNPFKRGGEPTKSSQSHTFRNQRRDYRPYGTHCKIAGHVVDRCYKLHGYPPGYNNKTRDNHPSSRAPNAVAHRVSTHDGELDYSNETRQAKPIEGIVDTLNPTQYQQLMPLLSTHVDTATQFLPNPDDCHVGVCFSTALNNGSTRNIQHWIADTGATRHICSSASHAWRPMLT